MAIKMRHLVIALPGVMGSVLQRNGKDAWALSGQAVWQYLITLGNSLQHLRIVDEDWQRDDLGDGIRATRLIQDVHSIPFLVEHAGYSVLVRRIKEFFDVVEGSIDAPRADANFFPFPYDWRRDCRVAARKLQKFIERQLPAWRGSSGAGDAKVILIGHSMGGLISRYYLECMEGWRDCAAVFTVGSPHRGALKILNLLSNGIPFPGLTDLVRSFRPAYQILPTYQVVDAGGGFLRPAEIAIPHIDQAKAVEARKEFLDAIRKAAEKNRGEPGYQQLTIPWVGTRHDTLQSASLRNGKLTVGYEPPGGVDTDLADGDGTVARVSAIPADLEGQGTARYAVERHGWLTNNAMALDPLLDTIREKAAPGTKTLFEMERPLAMINLRLESLFQPGEPVSMLVKLSGDTDKPQKLSIKAKPVGHRGSGATQIVQAQRGAHTIVELGELEPGLYTLTVGPRRSGRQTPLPVHGVFEVLAPDASA